ncbi:SDR family NAD(P)-dependent oxidoreductase [Methylobacillus flagellatus]|uniref:SDR family NAD(P)-dependent oxidoreductase n=1 Tax=Methylobacillus flagellatus TaxID=405 RepID=UPI002853E204|nr:SDR family NAD(P)-dependent oxidoreductase [Methylobacillus flagellatus]MDR5170446.1 SDR family NAD(P)-dependent oxidoreductase [Methylobacillus flagellatus]
MSNMESKVALITGANRGIGFETAKELGEQGIQVILAVRDPVGGEAAAEKLQALGIKAAVVPYEAGKPGAAAQVAAFVDQHFGKLDILVNNAGILKENLVGGNNSSQVEGNVLRDTFEVNFFAVIELTQALLPLIKRSKAGRIVNLSSILASLSLHSMPDSPIEQAKSVAYNTSKTALNAYTVHLAHELKHTAIKVNAAHPGWVKTALGGANAPMEVDGSGKTSAQLATLGAEGPSGGFFHQGEALPW